MPKGSRWTVRGNGGDAYWLRGKEIAVEGSENLEVVLKVWTLATLRGSLRLADRKRKLPHELLVSTLKPRASRAGSDVPVFQARCPVDSQGAWSCRLPAARYDLGLSAAGFSPTYRWDVEVASAAPRDLGALVLNGGGSVSGWIEVTGGGIDGQRCRAEVAPPVTRFGGNVSAAEKISQKAWSAPCQPEGLFQIQNLEPGAYNLAISQPGYSTVRFLNVLVERDAETFLRDVAVLRKPLRLHVAVLPASDPYGAPWRIRAFRREEGDPLNQEVFSASTDEAGGVDRPDVAPGLYRLEVESSQGERMSALDVSIEGTEESWQEIRVDWIEVEGVLRLGDRGTAGTLWFGGKQGLVSSTLQAAEDGRFAGLLPVHAGNRWWVDIETATTKTQRWLEVVPGPKKKARLEIVLPENRIFGRVVDGEGRAANQAQVVLESERADHLPEVVVTDADGRFETHSFPVGRVSLRAEAGRPSSFSGVVDMDLGEETEAGPIELRLQEGRSLAGELVGPFGPVEGAGLMGLPFAPPYTVAQARSGMDGRFSFVVPRGTDRSLVIVSPGGLPLTAFSVPVGEQPVRLPVSREMGALRLVIPGATRRDPLALPVYVEQNGLPLPMAALARRASESGLQSPGDEERVSFVVPQLATGSYRLCLSAAGELTPPAPGALCVSGQLKDGETLELDLESRFKLSP